MRQITKIVIHCSATKAGQNWKKDDIAQWHKLRRFPATGGTCCGYHYVIDLDGHIEIGKPVDLQGSHCKGYNAGSIGICYVGGLDEEGNSSDTRTYEQCDSLLKLVSFLRLCFPGALVYGHRDLARRDCPCFEVRHFFPTEWCGPKIRSKGSKE